MTLLASALRLLLSWTTLTASAGVPQRDIPAYDGCGLRCSVAYLAEVTGILSGDLPSTAAGMIGRALSFLSLLALLSVIAAGALLIVSNGDEQRKGRAKRMIWYTLVGLTVVLCARILVSLVTAYLPGLF
jgi:hypothetical protein